MQLPITDISVPRTLSLCLANRPAAYCDEVLLTPAPWHVSRNPFHFEFLPRLPHWPLGLSAFFPWFTYCDAFERGGPTKSAVEIIYFKPSPTHALTTYRNMDDLLSSGHQYRGSVDRGCLWVERLGFVDSGHCMVCMVASLVGGGDLCKPHYVDQVVL